MRYLQQIGAAVILTGASAAYAADVRLSIKPVDGSRYQATLDLSAPGKLVSGIQAEIAYDPAAVIIESVQATDALEAQEKEHRTFAPKQGVLRILAIGANPFPLLNKPIVAILFTSSAAGETALRLVSVTGASPTGDSVALTLNDSEEVQPDTRSRRQDRSGRKSPEPRSASR